MELTAAEISAELNAGAKDVVDESSRGTKFDPPLDPDQLAYFEAVATNESAIDVMGEGVLADIAITRVIDQMEAMAPRYAESAMFRGPLGDSHGPS